MIRKRGSAGVAVAVGLLIQVLLASPAESASPGLLLPVAGGTEVYVTQGNSTKFGHVASNGSQYAWDFVVLGRSSFQVVAARAGTVIGMRSDSTNTACRSLTCWQDVNYVLVDHGDGSAALYLHLATGSVSVARDQRVPQGYPLGQSDTTGYSAGPHLHFQVEVTPTNRTGASWWWTQSLPASFDDAGTPVGGDRPVSENMRSYVWRVGDTSSKIAHEFGVTYADLISANPNYVHPAGSFCLPGYGCKNSCTHTCVAAAPGETILVPYRKR